MVEREFETGKDEAWFANIKRTYDEYQQCSLDLLRKLNTHFDKVLSDAQQNDNTRQTIANQSLQNAVETANMVAKKTIERGDVAWDRIWNVDEVSALTAKSGVQADAFIVLLAEKVAEILKQKS